MTNIDDIRSIIRTRTASSGVDNLKKITSMIRSFTRRTRQAKRDHTRSDCVGGNRYDGEYKNSSLCPNGFIKTNVTTKVEIRNVIRDLKWQVGYINYLPLAGRHCNKILYL